MSYFLDTDILVGLLRKDKDAINKIKDLVGGKNAIYTSAINIHELVKGAELSQNHTKNLEMLKSLMISIPILSYDTETAFISGRISAELSLKGELIGQNDIFIGATVLNNKLKLITRNKKHFEKIKGIEILGW